MARLGFGFPAGRRRSNGSAAPAIIPVLEPSAAWSGSAGSGFAVLPQDPVRVTAKPALRLIVPPDQHFTDSLLVGFSAWANNEGTLIRKNGLKQLNVMFEGSVAEIRAPSLRSFEDANGKLVSYRAWWALLKRPAGMTGAAHIYAEAVPADANMQNRVIGPYSFTLTEALHDLELTVDPDNANGTDTFSDINLALSHARQSNAENPRISIIKSGTYSIDDAVVGPAYIGSGYALIEAEPNVVATIGYLGETRGTMRSKYDRLCLRGAQIVLDMSTIEGLYSENLGQHWLDGCRIAHPNGHLSLWNGTTRNVAYTVRGTPWFTEVEFEGVGGATANAQLVRGCVANNCFNDFAAQPKCVIRNRINNHDSSYFRTYIDALDLSYSGSGSATFSAWDGGSGGSAFRRFTFRVDGTEVATYESLTANWQSNSGQYWVSELVSFINSDPSLADWTAVLLDNTRQAGHLGIAGGIGGTFGETSVDSGGLTLKTFIDLHSDFSQMSATAETENVIIESNEAYDFQGQLIWVSSSYAIKDCFYINNTFNETNDLGGASQISRAGAKSHLVIAHNTLTQQGLILRDEPFGGYCLIANNVMPEFLSDGPDIGLGVVKDNHVYSTGSSINGSIETVASGDETSLFSDAALEDFTPSGELLTNRKSPVVGYDQRDARRYATEPVGARASTPPPPVVALSQLSLAHSKVSENSSPGQLISIINGTTPNSVLSLSDDAGGRFAIENGNLVLGSTPVDFEQAQSHSITLREALPTASNSPRETHATVTVINVLEAELSVLQLSANSVSENATSGTVVGSLQNTEAGSILELVDDADGRFDLIGLNIVTGLTPLDYETQTSHTIVVRESHSDAIGGSRETLLAIQVTNVVDTELQSLSLTNASITESAATGDSVGSVFGATAGSNLTLIDDAGARFALDGSTLRVGATLLDYEAATSHNIILRETHADAVNSPLDSVLQITVSNELEVTLGELGCNPASIAENSPSGTLVGAITNASLGSTLEIIDDAGGRFALNGQNVVTGVTLLDYENVASHQIIVRETHSDASNSPRETSITIDVDDVYEAPTPESELIGALAASSQSSFSDFTTATNSSDWIGSDISGNGNDFTQTVGSQKPGIDAVLGGRFFTGAAKSNVSYPISGGTFTVVIAIVKDPADDRGTPISNGSGGPGRYQLGSGIGLAGTCLVDNVQVTTAGGLYSALSDGNEHVLEWQGINASGWSQILIGRTSDSLGGSVRRVVVIDETTVGNLADARSKARDWIAVI